MRRNTTNEQINQIIRKTITCHAISLSQTCDKLTGSAWLPCLSQAIDENHDERTCHKICIAIMTTRDLSQMCET